MTELERRERHEAEIADAHELLGDAYRIWLDAQPYEPSEWMLAVRAVYAGPANDDAPLPANDNIDMDEAA